MGDVAVMMPAALTFPWLFFPGTQFKLGQPESPGKLYFVYYHASIDPMQLNPGYEMEHP